MNVNLKATIDQLKAFPTSVISDSMEAHGLKNGWLAGLKCLSGSTTTTYVGQVKTLQFAPNLFQNTTLPSFYEAVTHRESETILLLGGSGPEDTILGDNYAVAARVSGYDAVLVDGAVRDSATLHESEIGVFSVGVEGSHGDSELVAIDVPIMFRNRWIIPGDIVAADQDGAVVFPSHRAVDILRHAETIVELEKELRETIERRGSISNIKDIFSRKNNPTNV